MRFWNQVWLLMWKNCLIQRRRMCISIFQVLLPVIFSSFIIALRKSYERVEIPNVTYFDSQSINKGPKFPKDALLGYVPISEATTKVMDSVSETISRDLLVIVTLKGFKSEEESVAYFQDNSDSMQHIIVFHGVSSSSTQMPKKVSFSIRPHLPKGYWNTSLTFPVFLESKPRERATHYSDRGVLYLQTVVCQSLLQYWVTEHGVTPNVINVEIFTKRFPFPPYVTDEFIEAIPKILPAFIVGSFLFSVIIFTMDIVTEKENKLKESMKLMGLTSSAYWTSWYLTFSLYLVPAMALYTLILKLSIVPKRPVLYYSSASLLLVLLLIYAHTIITFCFMISTFVKKAIIGAVVSGILFFLFYCPYFYFITGFKTISRRQKMRYSVLLNTGMGTAISALGPYERSGEGATWGNFYQRAEDYSISMLDCMMMMLVGSIIHLLITWYMDNVRPGEFGVPKPYTFCFKRSYWCGTDNIKEERFRFDLSQSKYFEKDPTETAAGIRICNLRKVFRGRVAVAGTTLNMYEGQITVLLGHNGAGKSTTMSMITGSIPPTSGTAIVNGYDIRKNMDGVRRSLGLCLQHDVLFDKITVSEHLRFFAKMKGYSSPKLKEEIREMATKIGLESKLNTYAEDLSGGERRKLSVGIALIGGSKIVILDEPLLGMDPGARRHIWSILQEARKGRTLMLTTSAMNEADLLGDRVAIMIGGVIKCCGSPLYLKKLYGAGYHVIVVIKPGCDIPTLTAAIHSIIPQATLKTVVNTEVTYLLPDQESSKYATLFAFLNTEKANLHIYTFGTKPQTMEEVFLKAGGCIQDSDFTAENINTNMAGSMSRDGDLYLTVTRKSEGHVGKITDTIRSFFPTAEPTNISGQMMTFLLPGNDSDKLPALCHKLETSKHALNIINLSTSLQTKSSDVDNLPVYTSATCISNVQTYSAIALDFNNGFTKKQGLSLERSRITGVFIKKALLTRRNRIITLIQLVILVLFTCMATYFNVDIQRGDKKKEPPLTLNIVPFGETYIPYTDWQVHSAESSALTDMYKGQFCSCHNMEYVRLQAGETFDNFIWHKISKLNKSEYTSKMIIGMELVNSSSTDTVAVIAYYNNQPIHSEAISVNYVVNALLQFTLNSSFSLKSTISPLPWPSEAKKIHNEGKGLTGVYPVYFADTMNGHAAAMLIAFAMSFMTSFFIASLIREKQTGAKHIQIMTGISSVTYWVGTFLWDFVNLFVPSLVIPILFELFDVRAYTEDGRSGVVVLVLVLFCWAMLSFIYMLQFLFTSPACGIITMIIINFVSGVPTNFLVGFLKIPMSPHKYFGKILDVVCSLFFPNYNLASCLSDMYINYRTLKRCMPLLYLCQSEFNECCKDSCGFRCFPHQTDYLSFEQPGIGWYLISMVVQGLIFFLVVRTIEYNVIQMIWHDMVREKSRLITRDKTTEDSDVAAERVRINTTPMSALTPTDPLVVLNLYKRYHIFTAVDHICLGISEGECFGLLGQNGAGKTTTFKMITGKITLSGGNVYLRGFSVIANKKQVQANIGYCPQFDSLIDQLTGRETLTLYARLRGVPEESIDRVVDSLASFIKMTEYLDDYCGNYSGGNKRKLSTAIALIGDPPLLILDEPTSGLDPEAKRNMWTVLSRLRASGRTIVLATHSMEECDALCTRIAIMVNGRFMCLGSPQYLKNKFGQGYTIVMRLGRAYHGSFYPSEPIIGVITSTFPGSVVFDEHEGYIHFQVPQDNVEIAEIFSVMEKVKQEYHLQDYSVQQTTLEQVFLFFSIKQTAPRKQ